ncbi:uncharacterized protein LOC112692640 [Sipha flava]|uniref:Uncharacterized protein LOC112692640 n=1 Tax=Sipha flava TaxID=143950 RepID=A0A8B8GL46_9HEMI|nr:uncharacterized protein LOC112692640 [Sipha flava]
MTQIMNKITTKLNEVKRSILPRTFPVKTLRKYESAINRLRIGYTRTFNEKRGPSPTCICCRVPLTFILTECRACNTERVELRISLYLDEILSPEPDNVVKLSQFLTETHLINLL